LLSSRDIDHSNPLQKALKEEDEEAAGILLSYCEKDDVNWKNQMNETALTLAVEKNMTGFLENLFATSFDLNVDFAKDEKGETAIHLACLLDKPECVSLLIGYGADVNVKKVDGSCCLHICARLEHWKCFRALFESERLVPEVRDWRGVLPMHFLVEKKASVEDITMLLESEAQERRKGTEEKSGDIYCWSLISKNQEGVSCLDLAKEKLPEVVPLFLKYLPTDGVENRSPRLQIQMCSGKWVVSNVLIGFRLAFGVCS